MSYEHYENTSQIPSLFNIYEAVFGKEYKVHRFLDIGAYDGKTHSNTYPLLMADWHGVMVEPFYFEDIKRNLGEFVNNKKLKVISEAITKDGRSLQFDVMGEWSSSLDYVSTLAKSRGVESVRYVDSHSISFNKLMEQFRYPFDLLSLDIEGMELEIVEAIFEYNQRFSDLDEKSCFYPKVIIVELHELSEEWMGIKQERLKAKKVKKLLSKMGYQSIYVDDINTIFIRNNSTWILS